MTRNKMMGRMQHKQQQMVAVQATDPPIMYQAVWLLLLLFRCAGGGGTTTDVGGEAGVVGVGVAMAEGVVLLFPTAVGVTVGYASPSPVIGSA